MREPSREFIAADRAIDSISPPPRRGWFGLRNEEEPMISERFTACENCNAPLTGIYCAQCGQHAIDYRRSIWRVFVDAADSFFNWDTKFLKSVGLLLIRPSRLTNDFNAGRRVRHLHPLRLYLLASIAFFLLVKLVNINPNVDLHFTADDRAKFEAAIDKLSAPDSSLTPEQRAKLEIARTLLPRLDGAKNIGTKAKLATYVSVLPRLAEKPELKPKDVAKLDTLLDRLNTELSPNAAPPSPELSRSDNPTHSVPVAPTTKDTRSIIQFDSGDFSDTDQEKSPWGKWIEERVKTKVGENGTNAQLFLETLRNNIPSMMLCCIPLFALVLKLLYIRQRRFYVEHLVYALHIHTYVYMATVVITLLALALGRWSTPVQVIVTVALSCVVAAQVFLSIRRVYRQSWTMTTLKFVTGASAYFVVLATALGITAFVTLLLP